MKKIIVILSAIFSVCFLVACGGETKQEVSVNSSGEEKVNNESVVPESTEKPTEVPAPEVTPKPTPEPTADPVETLTALREDAMEEHSRIVEQVQQRYDIASEILEVVKGYPNFEENIIYEMALWTKSNFEQTILEGDINDIVGTSNTLNMAVYDLLLEYPDLETTEEFKRLVEAPELSIAYYNGYASVYNDTLANSTITGFEELPYCLSLERTIEYYSINNPKGFTHVE